MAEPVNQDMILGELRGQVRELVHSTNNLNAKFDALTREVIALGPLGQTIAENRAAIQAMQLSIKALEAGQERQAGARNLAAWFLQSPVMGWLVAAALFAAAWWKSK